MSSTTKTRNEPSRHDASRHDRNDRTRSPQSEPAPDDPRKPDDPTDLTKPSFKYTIGKTLREFGRDQCTDLAAALTYYSVLAVFPGLLALVSILGLLGQGQSTVDTLLRLMQQFGSSQVVTLLRGPIEGLVRSPAATVTFIIGIIGALWSASGYVGAFGRAMNRIYGVREGRPLWKLRPTMLGVTVFTVLMLVIGMLALVSGPIVQQFGNRFGLGQVGVTLVTIIQWPVLAAIAIIVLAVLYYWAPNVRQPKFAWISGGSIVAIVIWVIASVGFGFYVGNFSHYNKTYGSLGGVIVFLLWVWITNNALLFGAEFNAELERGRELQAGMHAEEHIQLPVRDERQIDKQNEQHAKDVLSAVRIRETAGRQR